MFGISHQFWRCVEAMEQELPEATRPEATAVSLHGQEAATMGKWEQNKYVSCLSNFWGDFNC